jgi:hypothetical protein
MAVIREAVCWYFQIRGWVRMMFCVGEVVVKKVQKTKTARLSTIDVNCEHML